MPNWLLPLILAPFIGSFVAVLVRQWPAGQSLAIGRSRCDRCGQLLRPWDLIPIVSFALLGGRCRRYSRSIVSPRLAAELACLGIAIWCTLMESEIQSMWLGCILGWTLLTLAWIDWQHMLLPDFL